MGSTKRQTKEPKPQSKPSAPSRAAPRRPASKPTGPGRNKKASAKGKGGAKPKAPAKPKRKTAKRKPPKTPKAVGRPSKIGQYVKVFLPNGKTGKVEPKVMTVAEAFVAVLETGCAIETAAAAVGISKQTVYDWLARAEEHRDSPSVPSGEQAYLDFSDALTRAREQVVTVALAGIIEAGKADWRAYAWFLERSRPDEWGRSTRIDLGGSDGNGGRLTFAELMAGAATDPSTASDADDPDVRS